MSSPSRIRSLEVILTAACNMRCGYCYQNAKQARRMEWDTLRPALDLVLRSDPREVQVRFMGGEPLLELPLMRRAVEYVGERRRAGKRVVYAISTNGTLVDEEAAQFLAAHEFETQLSFDGVPEAQNLRGRDTYPKLDALLDRLRGDFPRFYETCVHVALTLHSGNLRYLADSVAYFLGKRVPRISVGPLLTHDAGWRLEDIYELERQFVRIFDLSIEHLSRTGRVPFEMFAKSPSEPDRHKPVGRSMCGVSSGEGIAIDVDGQVTGCVTFAESYQKLPDFLASRLEPMKMGRIRNLDFRRRLALYPEATRAAGIFHHKEEKYSSYRRCADCEHLAECSICPISIGHVPGNSDPRRVPDLPCAYNLVAFRHRSLFPAHPRLLGLMGERPVPPLLLGLLSARGGGGRARAVRAGAGARRRP